MSDVNYFEIIKNKLDALVDKIIQKENSDESFRITYAQILEKINTKMDVFSTSNDAEKINMLSFEIKNLINSKHSIIDNKFNAVKAEFENINASLEEAVKFPELEDAFNNIQRQIHYFSEEIENQKFAFNSIVSHIEKFGTLEETQEILSKEFSTIQDQNKVINNNLNNCIELARKQNNEISGEIIDEIKKLDTHSKEFDEKFVNLIENINTELSVIAEHGKQLVQKGDIQNISEKVLEMSTELVNSKEVVSALSNNLTTLIDIVNNLFELETFENLKSDVSNILVNTTVLSEAIDKCITREALEELSSQNKEEIKQYTDESISALENRILEKLDFSDLVSIKDYTEKLFFQGTEVLKEEIWNIKDNIALIKENAITESILADKIDTAKEELIDVVSAESVASSYEMKSIKSEINNAKEELTDIISAESVGTSNQLQSISQTIENFKNDFANILAQDKSGEATQELKATIDTSLDNLQKQFIKQILQIAENISFVEEAEEIHSHVSECSNELKKTLSSDISAIKDEMNALKHYSKVLTSGTNNDDDNYLYTLPDVESDLSKIRLDLNNISKTLSDTDTNDTDSIYTSINNLKSVVEKLENSSDFKDVKLSFNTLNEDIASISKRTNKLILTSDEVNKTLRRHIDEFTEVIHKFNDDARKLSNSSYIINVSKKLDNLTRLCNSIISSDKVLNEAFMYMAEWIDSASETFSQVKSEVTEIGEKVSAGGGLKVLNEKLEYHEEVLETISKKLKNMNSVDFGAGDDSETKSLLQYIASQVGATNEKLNQRMDNLEKQIKKIEKNVNMLASYVSEED